MIRKKFLLGLAVFSFCLALAFLVFFISQKIKPALPETFKIYPVKFGSLDTPELTENILKSNKRTTRIKIIPGKTVELELKKIGENYQDIPYFQWVDIIQKKVPFDDFGGHRVYVVPSQINLHRDGYQNFIWALSEGHSIISSAIWEQFNFGEYFSFDDYILICIMGIITKHIADSHNPSTNRCLSDYHLKQETLKSSIQNGPFCNRCKKLLYDKKPEVLQDLYSMYEALNVKGKRDIKVNNVTGRFEIDGLLFPKTDTAFNWGSWFGDIVKAIIAAFCGVFFAYLSTRKKKKKKKKSDKKLS